MRKVEKGGLLALVIPAFSTWIYMQPDLGGGPQVFFLEAPFTGLVTVPSKQIFKQIKLLDTE